MQFIKIKEVKLTSLIFTIMSCWQKSFTIFGLQDFNVDIINLPALAEF